jgi:trimethylamine--corrinoid protein Co-methyltransferase
MPNHELLKEADLPTLAEAVLAVLEEVGILCQNSDLLDALEEQGATVDRADQVARFPGKLIEDFVETLIEENRGSQDPKLEPFSAPALPGLGTQVAQFIHDYGADEIRPGNRLDFVELVKLGDVLHEGAVGHCLLLTDVPPMVEPLEAALVLAEYARKPGPAFAWNVGQVDYLIEMGEIVGIADWFTWGANCFAHPLRYEKDVADKFVRRARTGASCGFAAMPVAGSTTPVTTAGFIVVSAAEQIAAWILARAVNPDAKLDGVVYGGSTDMATGGVSYSAFDGLRNALATVEFLRRWTGMAIGIGTGEYCDARVPGYFAAWEKAYKAMTIAAFTGRHPGMGQGTLEEGKVLSPVQLMLERELGLGVQLIGRPVEVTPETIALDTIIEVGFGIDKSYLSQDHTLDHFREDTWLPPFLDRSGYSGPEQERKVLDRLQDEIDELVASYRRPERDPDSLVEMRQVVERAKREIGNGA